MFSIYLSVCPRGRGYPSPCPVRGYPLRFLGVLCGGRLCWAKGAPTTPQPLQDRVTPLPCTSYGHAGAFLFVNNFIMVVSVCVCVCVCVCVRKFLWSIFEHQILTELKTAFLQNNRYKVTPLSVSNLPTIPNLTDQ